MPRTTATPKPQTAAVTDAAPEQTSDGATDQPANMFAGMRVTPLDKLPTARRGRKAKANPMAELVSAAFKAGRPVQLSPLPTESAAKAVHLIRAAAKAHDPSLTAKIRTVSDNADGVTLAFSLSPSTD